MHPKHHLLDLQRPTVVHLPKQRQDLHEEPIQLSESILSKFESFGFVGCTVDGHNENDIDRPIRDLWDMNTDQPKILIARTVKGKGVPFMENDNSWHYTRLNAETHAEAVASLAKGA